MNQETARLQEARQGEKPWRKFGPYLSERQWGTVREDYSENGDAWNYFPHDHARSRAYRWGEDGLAGISDDRQLLCFALALWNGKDPILKERLFGLTNSEGNHGEDVKECYYYLDSTPTHSWMRHLYKYPQTVFPYDALVASNRGRDRGQPELELEDTGIFQGNRYFDVFTEYAKNGPEDLLIRITVHNRGPERSELHVLPTLWFRNTWSWGSNESKPSLTQAPGTKGKIASISVEHPELGKMVLACEGNPELLFTENESNQQKLWGNANSSPFVKDSINDFIVLGKANAVNPNRSGTKASAHYHLVVDPGASAEVRLRLSRANGEASNTFGEFNAIFEARRQEADEFFSGLSPQRFTEDQRAVFRQAIAGMLWSKQFYHYDVDKWLEERSAGPWGARPGAPLRNRQWFHMVNADVISMPDKWEYPWYAAWDLAFHCWPLGLADLDFAKSQIQLMLTERYLHPNGQIPAYEWNFGDVNPPVHAWAALLIYQLEKLKTGQGDVDFLKNAFQKLLLNFTWWVNRKDPGGRNVFEGGFLGLDNIGVFDRSAPLPTGGCLEQADGTAWVAHFCQNMLQIALELAVHEPSFEDVTIKFFEHFMWIAGAMDRVGDQQDEMWDEADGFFYDVLRLPDGSARRLQVRSMVGLLPLCATSIYSPEILKKLPAFRERVAWFLNKRPDLASNIHDPRVPGERGRHMLAILNENKLRRVLSRLLDENEFLSPRGIRSLSRHHAAQPFVMHVGGTEHRVDYLPGESNTGMFGGNSNWRGPVWMPVNALIIRALFNFYLYYGDQFKVECPTGSGRELTLFEVANELANRLSSIFLLDASGKRPFKRDSSSLDSDPHFRDYVLFHEYFHGETGIGLGATHQTGWTGVVAGLMHFFGSVDSAMALNGSLFGKYLAETTSEAQSPTAGTAKPLAQTKRSQLKP